MNRLLDRDRVYAPALSTAVAERVGVSKYAPPFVDWNSPLNKCCSALSAARLFIQRRMSKHLAGIQIHSPGPRIDHEVMQTSPNIGMHFPPFSSKGCPTVIDFITKNFGLLQDYFYGKRDVVTDIPSINKTFLKDEPREIGKPARQIQGYGKVIYYLGQCYFADAADILYGLNAQEPWWGPGVSPLRGGWGRMYVRISENGQIKTGWQDDLPAQDSNSASYVGEDMYEVLYANLHRHPLFVFGVFKWLESLDIIHITLVGGDLIISFDGNASGGWATLIKNTWLTSVALVAAAIHYGVDPDDALNAATVFGDNAISNDKFIKYEMYKYVTTCMGFSTKATGRTGYLIDDLEFLSYRFCPPGQGSAYHLKPHPMPIAVHDNMDKIFSCLDHCYDDVHYFETLCGKRTACFTNGDTFHVVDKVCRKVIEKHRTDIPPSVLANYLTESELYTLYTGFQGANRYQVPTLKDMPPKKVVEGRTAKPTKEIVVYDKRQQYNNKQKPAKKKKPKQQNQQQLAKRGNKGYEHLEREIAALRKQMKADYGLMSGLRREFEKSLQRAMMRYACMMNPSGPVAKDNETNALVPFYGKRENARTASRAFEGRFDWGTLRGDASYDYMFLRGTNNPFSPVQYLAEATAADKFAVTYDEPKKGAGPLYVTEAIRWPTPVSGTAPTQTSYPLAHTGMIPSNTTCVPCKNLVDSAVVPSKSMIILRPDGSNKGDFGLFPVGEGGTVNIQMTLSASQATTVQWFWMDADGDVTYESASTGAASTVVNSTYTLPTGARAANVALSFNAPLTITALQMYGTVGAGAVPGYNWVGVASNFLESIPDQTFARLNGLEVLCTNLTQVLSIGGNIVQAYIPTQAIQLSHPNTFADLYSEIATFPKANTRDAGDAKGGWSCNPQDPSIPFCAASAFHENAGVGAEVLYIALRVKHSDTGANDQDIRVRINGSVEIIAEGNSPAINGQTRHVPFDLLAEQWALNEFNNSDHHFDNPDHPIKLAIDGILAGVHWVNGKFKFNNQAMHKAEEWLGKASKHGNSLGKVVNGALTAAAMFI